MVGLQGLLWSLVSYDTTGIVKIIDNKNSTLKSDLLTVIQDGSKVAIAASCFSIYAFQELKDNLKNINELRFIFTSPTFTTDKVDRQQREFYIPRLNRERTVYGSEFEVRLRNELTQRAIARECAEWIRQKACFKSNRTTQYMQGFINVDKTSYTPINGFTTVDLGTEQGDNAYSMILRNDYPESQQFLQLFEQVWNNSEMLQTVTDEVIDSITNVYKENAPEFLYFVTLYNIFNEFLDDISEDVLPNEATGFKQSVVWNKLYNFQRDAALAIINKLEKYNGCILADSVGLGKTFTALAVIKYYEGRNRNVLVLCPKKLHDNWETYHGNYVNNPLVADRLRYDVFFHSDLSRDEGRSNGRELANINWGNYDLVVIDESHNFRNGGKISTDENDENPRENRYLRLMNKIIRAGVKTKVLMLSATPVNNRFNDLKNQLQLAYEGESERLDALLNTDSSIDDIFRNAQRAYNQWTRLPQEERTTKRLLGMLSFDFFELLDSVTIARSRKHIEQYYDTTDIGKFPTRLKPLSRRPNLTDLNEAINYNEISAILEQLNLAVYTPSAFLLPSRRELYGIDTDDEVTPTGHRLSIEDRERGIRRLMSIQMLKRLESSVNSFRLTVQRINAYIEDTIRLIDTQAMHSQIDDYMMAAEPGEWDIDDAENDAFIGRRKNRIRLSDIDYVAWRKHLAKDNENFKLLLLMLADITPEHDSKLQQLIQDLREKFAHPINEGNKKVIIFTAFSDTAEYLYKNLAPVILEKHGLHTAMVSGDVEARSTLKLREKLDFNKALTLFSPISKEKASLFPNVKGEIDVLIGTDCISEGQNLQDCDYLINYDIHWNPVRIIQRFGRIDRIGSRNEVIQLVNYWPNITLDEYINLKARVEARMKASVLTATGDENPLTTGEQDDLDYRRQQLKRLQEEVVDIEEMNNGVSIMDLGLNEFRLDLLEYMRQGHDIEHTPYGLHTVVASRQDTPPGVIFVLKNRNNGVNIDRKNQLHPFYMVYIGNDGNVVVNHLAPKELFDRMRQLCRGKAEPDKSLCRLFNRGTRDGRNMKHYSGLLGDAIKSIISVKQDSDIDSFLGGVQGSLFAEPITGLDDFELICFLVIK